MNTLAGLRVTLLAGTLGQGGAERQLFLAATTLKRAGAFPRVLTLGRDEFWEAPLRDGGIEGWWQGLLSNGYPPYVPLYVLSAEVFGALLLIPGVLTRYVALYAVPMMLGATQFWLVRKTIDLTYDEASCTDRFDRTLAYVKVDGVDLNAELAKQGLACFLFVKPGGEARQEEFATYEAEARTNRTGMWGSCTVIPCSM